MTLPSRDSLATFGGTLGAGYVDYSPVLDPTVDMPAAAGNQALSDVAMLTRTAVRAWARFTPAGTGTPVLVSNWALWGTGSGAQPAVARSGVGIYTLTWPATVTDDLTVSSAAGYLGPQTLALLAAEGQTEGATFFSVQASASANVATLWIFGTGNTLADPNGPTILALAY
jgi:hypothetical protein